MKFLRPLLLAPVVAVALVGLACSQPEAHPQALGDCLDPVICNPPKTGDGGTKDAGPDAMPTADAGPDAPSADAGDAASDAADAG